MAFSPHFCMNGQKIIRSTAQQLFTRLGLYLVLLQCEAGGLTPSFSNITDHGAISWMTQWWWTNHKDMSINIIKVQVEYRCKKWKSWWDFCWIIFCFYFGLVILSAKGDQIPYMWSSAISYWVSSFDSWSSVIQIMEVHASYMPRIYLKNPIVVLLGCIN